MAFGFQNFMAASRKPNLKPFGLMAQSQDLTWIISYYAVLQLVSLAGTQDGTNAVFTLSAAPGNGSIVFVNGIGLYEGVAYTRSGTGITFSAGYAPQSTDVLRVLTW